MVLSAKRRIEAARYHLNLMRTNLNNREKFTFDLEAFLSAARSVTWLLKKELKHKEGFEQWWKVKEEQMEKDDLMKFFVKKRNYALKEEVTPLKGTFARSYSVDLVLVDRVDVKLIKGEDKKSD